MLEYTHHGSMGSSPCSQCAAGIMVVNTKVL